MRKKLEKIYTLMFESYGPQGWWPVRLAAGTAGFDEDGYHKNIHRYPVEFAGRFDIITGAILTQNTNWKNVESAMDRLYEAGAMCPKKMLKLPGEALAELVKPSGYFNQKAKKLKAVSRFLIDEGYAETENVPSRKELLGIWGVGEETADSILLYAYHQPWFVIDAYTKRIFSRLGFSGENGSYRELQELFHQNLPKDVIIFNEYHALIVEHAKVSCNKKPVCRGCVLKAHCAYGKNP